MPGPANYAYNSFDGSMLIGAWRALSELILEGRFESLNLDRFHCSRLLEGHAEPETKNFGERLLPTPEVSQRDGQ